MKVYKEITKDPFQTYIFGKKMLTHPKIELRSKGKEKGRQ